MKKTIALFFLLMMICMISLASTVMGIMPVDPLNELGQTETTKSVPWTYASSWAEEELNKANNNNLIPVIFNGADLSSNVTRLEFAHIVVVLYEKITCKPIQIEGAVDNPFTDTADGAVVIAYNLGITNGTSDTTFTPDSLITREQMATMMTRALSQAGINTANEGPKEKFNDHMDISKYAIENVYFMSANGIIKGIGNNTFNPKGNASKEQALLISERIAENFVK